MASKTACINLMCKTCSYDSCMPGSWRSQVEACTVTKCPLWPVRPVTSATIIAHRKVKLPIGNTEDEDDETSDE